MSWGLENRISKIIQPDGKTLMFAVDHGYFLGAIKGLEKPKKMMEKISVSTDAIMLTRGFLTSSLNPKTDRPIILRADGGPSIAGAKAKPPVNNLANHEVMITLEDALKLNASAVAISIFVGTKYETQTMKNLSKMVSEAEKYGMPVLAVTAVGTELDNLREKENQKEFKRYLKLACRMASEHGAHIVKTYYCEKGFEEVTESCLTPVVMAGGKSGNPLAALKETYQAIKKGAIGVDMGRNIFQAQNPAKMITAIRSIIHKDSKPKEAYKIYKKK